MSKKLVTVTATTSITSIWRSIFHHHINAIPVVNTSKKLLGFITREDMVMCLYPNYKDMLAGVPVASDFEEMEKMLKEIGGKKSSDIMNRQVIYTRESTPIMRALSRMIVRNVDQLPVLDEDDRVVGMITKGDIFYTLFKLNFPKKNKKLPKSTKKAKK